MKIIDLRSDTVTQPTPAMREAMFKADVGDDGFGDDPTVNRLQELSAQRVGMEAGLFVPSGTMGNLICLLTHCERAQEVILGAQSHIFRNERGSMAAVAGLHARTIKNNKDGTLDLDEIEKAINSDANMYATTKLICLENTWNGRVLKQDYMAQVREIARRHDLKLHLDGARIFNAAVALNVSPAQLCKGFDSVQFCFSKGLSAPIGSMICGSAEFIRKARQNRQMLGGTMRQVGVVAAAAMVALNEMVDRLKEDHETARMLADGLAQFEGLSIDPATVETNIVFFKVDHAKMNARQLAARLAEQGLRVIAFTDSDIRAVTHDGITASDIKATLSIFSNVLSPSAATR